MLPGRTWTWQVFLLLTFSSSLCAGQAILSFVQTSFVVQEGQQFFVQVLKNGEASSDVNVVVEVKNQSKSILMIGYFQSPIVDKLIAYMAPCQLFIAIEMNVLYIHLSCTMYIFMKGQYLMFKICVK